MSRLERSARRGLVVAVGLLLWTFVLPAVPVGADGPSCTVTTTGVAFGSYDVLAANPTDSTGFVTCRCTGTGSRSITLDLSAGGSGAYSVRQMRHGSLRLGYNLYLDALRSSIWGNGTSGTDHLSTTVPANGSVNVTIYGRISAKQDARIGAYSDTITVTATF